METTAKSTEQIWSNPEALLLDRIIDYIGEYGPSKVSRLRDKLNVDSKEIAQVCELGESLGRLVSVKPAGVYIWAFPREVELAELAITESILSYPDYAYVSNLAKGKNAAEREFRRGVIRRMIAQAKISINHESNGFCRLLKEA
jgi:hypothetical protein